MNSIIDNLLGNTANSLSEDAQKTIKENFESAVKESADKLVEERQKLALEVKDNEYAEKLQTIIERFESDKETIVEETLASADEIATGKLKQIFEKMEKFYSEKIETIQEGVEVFKHTEVKNKIDELSDKVDLYLEEFLDSAIPTETFNEMAIKDHNESVVNEISRLISVNQIDDQVKEQVVTVQEENVVLQRKLDAMEKAVVLEQKCKGLPSEIADFVTESFKDTTKTVEDIEKNFDFVVGLYNGKQKQELKQEKKSQQKISKTNNDQRPQELLSESANVERGVKGNNSMMSNWVNGVDAHAGTTEISDSYWDNL